MIILRRRGRLVLLFRRAAATGRGLSAAELRALLGKVRVVFLQITERAGVVMGNEIGTLVDGGFQKFFQAPSGEEKTGARRKS